MSETEKSSLISTVSQLFLHGIVDSHLCRNMIVDFPFFSPTIQSSKTKEAKKKSPKKSPKKSAGSLDAQKYKSAEFVDTDDDSSSAESEDKTKVCNHTLF